MISSGDLNTKEEVKIMKRVFSFFLVLFMLSALSVPGLAVEQTPSSPTTVTQFAYTVYDEDGNIVKTGVTPDFSARYEWTGITIENGETVAFTYPDGRGFYILEGKTANVYALFNKNVSVKALLSRSDSGSSITGEVVYEKSYSLASGYVTEIDIEKDGYYTYMLRNASDGPITVKELRFTW